MNYRLKFRAIGIIIIFFCLAKRISLILESDKIDNVISIEQVKSTHKAEFFTSH